MSFTWTEYMMWRRVDCIIQATLHNSTINLLAINTQFSYPPTSSVQRDLSMCLSLKTSIDPPFLFFYQSINLSNFQSINLSIYQSINLGRAPVAAWPVPAGQRGPLRPRHCRPHCPSQRGIYVNYEFFVIKFNIYSWILYVFFYIQISFLHLGKHLPCCW